jgi:hypothetical protein
MLILMVMSRNATMITAKVRPLSFYAIDLLVQVILFSTTLPGNHDHGHDHEHKHSDHHEKKEHEHATTATEEEVPAWKKQALEAGNDPMAAPFGGNWNTESSLSASDSGVKKMEE